MTTLKGLNLRTCKANRSGARIFIYAMFVGCFGVGSSMAHDACSFDRANINKAPAASAKSDTILWRTLRSCSLELEAEAKEITNIDDNLDKVPVSGRMPTTVVPYLTFDRQKNIEANRDRAIILFNEQQYRDTQRDLRDLLQQQQTR